MYVFLNKHFTVEYYFDIPRPNLYRIFIYGTLKTDEPNHSVLLNLNNGYAKYLGVGQTKSAFPLIISSPFNIPKMLYEPGIGYRILGEIYETDHDMFEKIDVVEDYPEGMNRKMLKIEIADGRLLPCHAYVACNYPSKLLNQTFYMSYKNSTRYPYCACSRPNHIKL